MCRWTRRCRGWWSIFPADPGCTSTSRSPRAWSAQLVFEFFQGFVNHALVSLHIDNLKGVNAHHQAETVFKAFGRALRMALTPDPRSAGIIPSTKGSL